MIQKVFNRIEKKYLLNETTYCGVREALEQYMEEDSYGLHNIRNIYYDTDTDELIRRSLEKPVYKEKFRVRCYGQPEEDSDVFLEIKKKYRGLVNKRRMTLKLQEARDYLEHGILPQEEGVIFSEIDFFLNRYKPKPKLYLAYDRVALFGRENAEFRVTFDKNIRSRSENLTLRDDTGTKLLMEPGSYLMEVKALDAMPLWFTGILSEQSVYPVSFSKYGSIYRRQLLEGMHDYSAAPGADNSIWVLDTKVLDTKTHGMADGIAVS